MFGQIAYIQRRERKRGYWRDPEVSPHSTGNMATQVIIIETGSQINNVLHQ